MLCLTLALCSPTFSSSCQEFSLEAAYHGGDFPSGQASIAKITVKSPPDVVNKNAASPPWITVSLQQDGNGLLQFNEATTIEAYIVEKTVKPEKKESDL